jgi:hypothetical protein
MNKIRVRLNVIDCQGADLRAGDAVEVEVAQVTGGEAG